MFGLEPVTVDLTLYTDSLVVKGSVSTTHRRITDILNLADQPFLILEDATVEELGARGTPIKADVAQINLDSVLFAVANVPIEASPDQVRRFAVLFPVNARPTQSVVRRYLLETR